MLKTDLKLPIELKVKTEQNLEGWVYGGAVTFDVERPTTLSNTLLEKRQKLQLKIRVGRTKYGPS